MAQRYDDISRVFSEGELILIEDALREFNPSYLTDDHGQEELNKLKADITAARRWAHHFGKSQH